MLRGQHLDRESMGCVRRLWHIDLAARSRSLKNCSRFTELYGLKIEHGASAKASPLENDLTSGRI